MTFTSVSEIPVSTFAGDLEALVSAIGASERTILVDQAVTLSGDLVVPDNITLRFTRDGMVDGAHTLTVNGPSSPVRCRCRHWGSDYLG